MISKSFFILYIEVRYYSPPIFTIEYLRQPIKTNTKNIQERAAMCMREKKTNKSMYRKIILNYK